MNKEIAKTIKELDPQLQPDNPHYEAAAFLLASCKVGPSQTKVRELTGLNRSRVSQLAYFAKKNGIWKGRKVYGDWAGENGGIAFWCDVLVLNGIFTRA